MYKGASMKRKRTGFTLIELLVVIAIIAILASILLPALKVAQSTAKAIKCVGNQRQLLLAMNSYLSDYNDVFPAQKIGTVCWGEQLCPYLGMQYSPGNTPQSSVIGCPEQRLWPGNFMRWSYVYNSYLFGSDDYTCVNGNPFWGRPRTPPPPIRTVNISSPTEQLVFADGWTGPSSAEYRSGGYPYLDSAGYFGLRHHRRCNVGYLDGNVKSEGKANTMDAHPAFYPINATCENKPYYYYLQISIYDYSPY